MLRVIVYDWNDPRDFSSRLSFTHAFVNSIADPQSVSAGELRRI
jgi:hypothetical protein